MRRPAPRPSRRPRRQRPSPPPPPHPSRATRPAAPPAATPASVGRRGRPGSRRARRDRDRRPPRALGTARRGRLDPSRAAAAERHPARRHRRPGRGERLHVVPGRPARVRARRRRRPGLGRGRGPRRHAVGRAGRRSHAWLQARRRSPPTRSIRRCRRREGTGGRDQPVRARHVPAASGPWTSSTARGSCSRRTASPPRSRWRAPAPPATRRRRWTTCCGRTTGRRSRRARRRWHRCCARRDGAWMVEGDGDRGAHFLALRIANMAFAQDGYALEQAYMERVSRTFRSGVGLVDYIGDARRRPRRDQPLGRRADDGPDPEAADATRRHPDTRLVLVNAVYFKGEWLVPFEQGEHGSAHVHDGSGQGDPRPDDGDLRRAGHPDRVRRRVARDRAQLSVTRRAPARDDDRRARQPGDVREGAQWRPAASVTRAIAREHDPDREGHRAVGARRLRGVRVRGASVPPEVRHRDARRASADRSWPWACHSHSGPAPTSVA